MARLQPSTSTIKGKHNHVWFTADQHFYHERIIILCNRPFADQAEMHGRLIQEWNDNVAPGDTVYHLGDFCLGGVREAQEIIAQLHGNIHILGTLWHHDCRWIEHAANEPNWRTAGGSLSVLAPLHVIEVTDAVLPYSGRHMRITLCHYPMRAWEQSHYGAIHLHAHEHGRMVEIGRSMDVGVDATVFAPVSLDAVLYAMGCKTFPAEEPDTTDQERGNENAP